MRRVIVGTMVFALCVCGVGLGAGPDPCEITGVIIYSVSDELNPAPWTPNPPYEYMLADYMLDGSGLTAATGVYTNGAVAGHAWMTHNTYPVSEHWVIFDLGDFYDLNSVRIWNCNEKIDSLSWDGTPRGVKDMVIQASAVPSFSGGTAVTVAQASGLAEDISETFNVNFESVRYVRFDIGSNHSGGTDKYLVISEVRFAGEASGPPANSQPLVDIAEAHHTIQLSETLDLTADVSDDGNPNPPGALTTTWSKLSGPGTVTFGNSSELTTTADFSAEGEYELFLYVTDGLLDANDILSVRVITDDYQEIPGVEAIASSYAGEVGTWGEPRIATRTVDSSGLNMNGIGPGTHGTNADDMWQSNGGTQAVGDQWLIFNLHHDVDLDMIRLWNFNEFIPDVWDGTDRGVKDVDIYVSAIETTDPDDPCWVFVDSITFARAAGSAVTDISEFQDCVATGVAMVKFDIQTNHAEAGDEWVGIAEVRFSGTITNSGPDVDAADLVTWMEGASATVTTQATLVDDENPVPATLTWSQLTGPGVVQFSSTSILNPELTFDQIGEYELKLSANDTRFTDSVIVTVNVYTDSCTAAKADPEWEALDGDINADCEVNLLDVAMMAGNWLNGNYLE